jgi:hypothetical protein
MVPRAAGTFPFNNEQSYDFLTGKKGTPIVERTTTFAGFMKITIDPESADDLNRILNGWQGKALRQHQGSAPVGR